MARKTSFTPPDDDPEDVLSVLAAAPASRPSHPEPARAAAAPTGPASAESPERTLDEPTETPVGETTTASTPSAASVGNVRRAAGSVAGQVPRRLKARRTATEPIRTAAKRLGLYIDNELWLWLKRLSIERAERGQPADFTSIFVEALDEKYRR